MLKTGTPIAWQPNPDTRVTGQVLLPAGDWLLVRLDTPPNQIAPYPHPWVVPADAVEVLHEPKGKKEGRGK